jgi:predicted small metal-binding protein
MTKVLKCGDLNPGCAFEARGRDENEVPQKAAQHAKSEHGMAAIPQEMMSKVRNAIHDEDSTLEIRCGWLCILSLRQVRNRPCRF